MSKTTTEMQLVAVSKLIPYVNNARTHSAEQVMKIRSSLREFGFINPVIIDREFNVIAGHGRILAAKEEGILEVPCVFVDYLTEAQKKAYILADNRMAMDAGWDEELLRIEIEALQSEDFDIGLTGFDESEIADLFGSDDTSGVKDDDYDLSAALEKAAFVKRGDIWTVGRHRLMSIAGKRDGLGGSRSSLFYEAVRIIKEMRCKTDGRKPRFIVWENVPGAFSSNKGEDFRTVLEEVCKIKDESVSVPKPNKWNRAGKIMGDNYSVAWRQFDAQFWGVPQRRKRIYLVADFADWCAGKILFESEGLSGYSKESIQSWQSSASAFREGTQDAGIGLMFENHGQDARYTGPLDVSQTVLSTYGTGGNNQPFVVETPKTLKIRSGCEGGGKGPLIQENKSATLGTNNDQTLFQPVAYGICSKDSNSMKSANPNSGFYEADTSRTIDGNGGNPGCNQGGIAVIEGNGTRLSHKGDGYKESDVMYTLNATEQHAVAFADIHATLSANDGPKGPSSQMMGNPHENFVGEPACWSL